LEDFVMITYGNAGSGIAEVTHFKTSKLAPTVTNEDCQAIGICAKSRK
jgi:hypothetical protein